MFLNVCHRTSRGTVWHRLGAAAARFPWAGLEDSCYFVCARLSALGCVSPCPHPAPSITSCWMTLSTRVVKLMSSLSRLSYMYLTSLAMLSVSVSDSKS